MSDNAINAEVFATMKVKKKAATITPKPRTALLQEGENDVTISASVCASNNSYIPSNARRDNGSGNPPFLAFGDKCNHSETLVDNSSQTNGGSSNVGVNLVGANPQGIIIDTCVDPKILPMSEHQINDVEIMPKPRTALFQGREDDESMAPQIISACEIINYSPIRFGSLFFAGKPNYMKEVLAGSAAISTKVIFEGVNFHKKREEMKTRKYIYIGAMEVDVDDVLPT
jgi:hypothetical protein